MGIIENKLILKDVLTALGLPYMEPLYGAFAHDFDDHKLRTAVRREKHHSFVLKPLTDGASHGVKVFDAASWVEKVRPDTNIDTPSRFMPHAHAPCPMPHAPRTSHVASTRNPPLTRHLRRPPSSLPKGAVEFGHLHPGVKQTSHHYDYTAFARGSEDVLIQEARRIITKASEWGQKYAVGGVVLEPRYDLDETTGLTIPGVVELKCTTILGVAVMVRGMFFQRPKEEEVRACIQYVTCVASKPLRMTSTPRCRPTPTPTPTPTQGPHDAFSGTAWRALHLRHALEARREQQPRQPRLPPVHQGARARQRQH